MSESALIACCGTTPFPMAFSLSLSLMGTSVTHPAGNPMSHSENLGDSRCFPLAFATVGAGASPRIASHRRIPGSYSPQCGACTALGNIRSPLVPRWFGPPLVPSVARGVGSFAPARRCSRCPACNIAMVPKCVDFSTGRPLVVGVCIRPSPAFGVGKSPRLNISGSTVCRMSSRKFPMLARRDALGSSLPRLSCRSIASPLRAGNPSIVFGVGSKCSPGK